MEHMESRIRSANDNEAIRNPYTLANKFAPEILGAVSAEFNLMEEVSLLSEDESGIYMSKEEPDMLCCLVLGNKNGHLYLVTGKVSTDGKVLSDFKTAVIG